MAGPGSRPRSTKVVIPRGSKHQGNRKRKDKLKGHKADAVTWDYDNSDSDETTLMKRQPGDRGTSNPSTKKRPRVEKVHGAAPQTVSRISSADGEEASRKLPTNSTSSSDEEAVPPQKEGTGDNGLINNNDEGQRSNTRDGGDEEIGSDAHEAGSVEASSDGEGEETGGGMGNVMAKILEQKVDTRKQVGWRLGLSPSDANL